MHRDNNTLTNFVKLYFCCILFANLIASVFQNKSDLDFKCRNKHYKTFLLSPLPTVAYFISVMNARVFLILYSRTRGEKKLFRKLRDTFKKNSNNEEERKRRRRKKKSMTNLAVGCDRLAVVVVPDVVICWLFSNARAVLRTKHKELISFFFPPCAFALLRIDVLSSLE